MTYFSNIIIYIYILNILYILILLYYILNISNFLYISHAILCTFKFSILNAYSLFIHINKLHFYFEFIESIF